jgi:hypothetical protein
MNQNDSSSPDNSLVNRHFLGINKPAHAFPVAEIRSLCRRRRLPSSGALLVETVVGQCYVDRASAGRLRTAKDLALVGTQPLEECGQGFPNRSRDRLPALLAGTNSTTSFRQSSDEIRRRIGFMVPTRGWRRVLRCGLLNVDEPRGPRCILHRSSPVVCPFACGAY